MENTVEAIFESFIQSNGSDLYLTVGTPPCIRLYGVMDRLKTSPLIESDIRAIMQNILSKEAIEIFETQFEYNTAIVWGNGVRLRVNIFKQKQHIGMVIRRVHTKIPTLESLGLPTIYGDLIMEKRGLILIVGQTGAGKSSTLAAMVGHRNEHGCGHIITIEDPIEFEHNHQGCIITQRDVGIDTLSYSAGLKNALRQMPDVIAIGEIRDEDTMQNAIAFAETGHLCIATLHGNNTNQAIERIINFSPEERRGQILMNLSLNLRAVLSQRLVKNTSNTRTVATEVMLNVGQIREMILEGHIKHIRELVEKGASSGMHIFEQSLLKLHDKNIITEEEALAEADSPANLRLAMRQQSMMKYEIGKDSTHAGSTF
jgi:twitching motility protein PilU